MKAYENVILAATVQEISSITTATCVNVSAYIHLYYNLHDDIIRYLNINAGQIDIFGHPIHIPPTQEIWTKRYILQIPARYFLCRKGVFFTHITAKHMYTISLNDIRTWAREQHAGH